MRIYRRAGGEDDDEEEGSDGPDDEDDIDGISGRPNTRPPRPPKEAFEAAKKPQQRGVELLMSGEFGKIAHKLKAMGGDVNVAKRIMNRRYGARLEPIEDVSAVSRNCRS